MKTKLPIQSNAQIIGVALLTLTAVTAFAENEAKMTKSFKVHQGAQLVVAADRGSTEVRTSGGGRHLGGFGGDIKLFRPLFRPLVDTPSLAD